MAKRKWDVTLDDHRHRVDLDRGVTGRVKVLVDGEQVLDERTAAGDDVRFEIAGRSAIVRLEQKWWGANDFRLIVDGAEIP
jgi:hypothetical protein